MKPTNSDRPPVRVRISVTLPGEDHQELEHLARQKKVSVAWMIRDAVDQYLSGRRVLLNTRSESSPADRGH